jgi:mono/diheme cytochrome c family protein
MKAKKIVAIVAVSLVSLVALVAGGATVQYDRMFDETFVVAPHQVAPTTSPEDLAEGERLLKARGCADCHGSDFAGKHFLDDPGLGKLASANITGGKGSAVGSYTDLDLERIIRHSVRPTGKPLFFMPAHEYWFLSDLELGRILQALRQVPKVDREAPPHEPKLLLKLLTVFGVFDGVPARLVDHNKDHEPGPAVGETPAFGQYLAVTCKGCHGKGFAGGPIPGAPPSIPVPTNLTPAKDGLLQYDQAGFVVAMRTGKRPDGTDINPFMPWKVYSHMTDTELKALYAYLMSLPAREFGGR